MRSSARRRPASPPSPRSLADASRDGGRLGRRAAGLPRASRSSPTSRRRRPRLVAIRDLADEMSVGEYAALAHRAVDELVESPGSSGRCGRNRPLPACGARRSRAFLLLGRTGAARMRGGVLRRDPAAAHARSRSSIPRAAAIVHPNDRRRVVRALELAEAGSSLVPERDRLWSAEYRRPTLVVGLDALARRARTRIRRANGGDVRARRCRGSAQALAGRVSSTAEKALGLSELSSTSAERGPRAHRRSDAALCRVPEEVDAPDSGHRHDRRRPDSDRGGGCDSRSGRRSVTPTCSSSEADLELAARCRRCPQALRPPPRRRSRRCPRDRRASRCRGRRPRLESRRVVGRAFGNGARIAAMWLARRSGVAFPRLHLGGRTVPARVRERGCRGRPRRGRTWRSPRRSRSTANASK